MQRKFLLKRFVVGLLGTNCYLVADTSTKEACLIDPGSGPYPIKDFIKKEGLDVGLESLALAVAHAPDIHVEVPS